VIPERMRSRTRLLASGIILLIITFSFYSRKAIKKPKNLPTGAENYSGETQESQRKDVVQEFLQRPILSYAESLKLNSKTCPTEGVNFDEGAIKRISGRGDT
jgi:alpha 1,2-mannosyltransferase